MERLKAAQKKAVGSKEVIRGLKSGTLERVYVANDVDTFLYEKVVRAAETAGIPVTRVETMKELGEACGLRISAAAAGIVKN